MKINKYKNRFYPRFFVLLSFVTMSLASSNSLATVYYSNDIGTNNPNQITNWCTNLDQSTECGGNPVDFTDVNDVFIIKEGHSFVIESSWNVAGSIEVYGNIIYSDSSSAGKLTLKEGSIVTLDGDAVLTVSGDLTIEGGELKIGEDETVAGIIVNGNYSQTGGIVEFNAKGSSKDNSSILQLHGNFSHLSGSITESADNDAKIVFAKAGEQAFFSSANDINDNVKIEVKDVTTLHLNSDAVFPDSIVVDGIVECGNYNVSGESAVFVLNAGACLKIGSVDGITLSGDTGNIRTGSRSFSEAAHYVYNGSVSQVTGDGLPAVISGSLTINNTIDAAVGGVTLSNSVVVSGTVSAMNLTNGRLITDANLLTLDTNCTLNGGSDTSFVDGHFKRVTNSGNEWFFPVGAIYGADAYYKKIGVIPESSTVSEYTVEAFAEGFANTYDIEEELSDVSGVEYWNVTRNSGADARVKLYWNKYSGVDENTAVTDLVVAHWNHSLGVWESVNGDTVDTDIDYVVSDLNYSFSEFTFGSTGSLLKDGGSFSLPIDLVSFSGKNTNAGNVLIWITASETNNDYFTVESSTDAVNWHVLTIINGAGNSNSLIKYTYTDESAYNGVTYYRLKQTDFNGENAYFKPIAVRKADENTSAFAIVSKNVDMSNNSVNLVFKSDDENTVNVSIYDMASRCVYYKSLSATEGVNKINLDARILNSGLYVITLEKGNNTLSDKLFVNSTR